MKTDLTAIAARDSKSLLAIVILIAVLTISEVYSQTAFRRNGKIAFNSAAGVNSEIYVMGTDGSGQSRLTFNNVYDGKPAWSPDGKRIAFISQKQDGNNGIFVMNADGTGRAEVTSAHSTSSLRWSPDGRLIAFDDVLGEAGAIFLVNADGGGRVNITSGHLDLEPVWSPDGQRILFTRYGSFPPVGYFGTMLHTINADGTDLRPLLNGFADGWNEDMPDWSPAVNKIIYSVNRWDFSYELYIANPDGTGRSHIEGCNLFFSQCDPDRFSPRFSPSGTKIVFATSSRFSNGPSQIIVKNMNGTGRRLLADNAGNPSWQPIASFAAAFDYDGDGRSDLSTQRGSNNIWYVANSAAGYTATHWGEQGDRSAPADFDGDGRTDVAIFRPSEGKWYVRMTGSQAMHTVNWGEVGDIPVPTDHDADGRADYVVFRPSNNTWYTRFANDTFSTTLFGEAGDKPVVGDFDGDGKGDIAVYRPSDNNWYILRSRAGYFVQTWGEPGDQPVTGDFDGDGATDHAVFRPTTGQWYLSQTTAGFAVRHWGVNGDVPVAADYDGDGSTDIAVFRPSEGNWYIVNSTAGMQIQHFGQNGDVPTQSAFLY